MIGRTNIRQRLRNNDVVISAMLRFPSPAAMEIMALAGVDLVIIDNEHYPFDEETMIDLVRAADVRGMACAVRVPNAEPTASPRSWTMAWTASWSPRWTPMRRPCSW